MNQKSNLNQSLGSNTMSDICNRIDGMVADEKRAIDEYTNFLPEIPHDDLSKKGKTIYGHNFYIAFSNLRDEKEEHLKTLLEFSDILGCKSSIDIPPLY